MVSRRFLKNCSLLLLLIVIGCLCTPEQIENVGTAIKTAGEVISVVPFPWATAIGAAMTLLGGATAEYGRRARKPNIMRKGLIVAGGGAATVGVDQGM